MILKGTHDKDKTPAETGGEEPAAPAASARLRPGIADYVAGEQQAFAVKLSPYLPQDMVGGSIPHVPGTEDEAVWNAAAQACGTERVHYCYSVQDGRIWYLACPSASLASHPDSWCPLAKALPGRSHHWDRTWIYMYDYEGTTAALRWDPETGRMQVYLGASRTITPWIHNMHTEFVSVPAEGTEIIPWRNRALRSEKLSRAAANAILYVGLALNIIVIIFLLAQYVVTGMTKRELASVKAASESASQTLMVNAYNALQSDTIKHMVRIQELLDALQKIDGTLVKYEVKGGKVTWQALLPPSFKECEGALKGCKVVKLESDSRIRVEGTR